MPAVMDPLDLAFVVMEGRERPMHVGGLQLFTPPADAGPDYIRDIYDAALEDPRELHPLLTRRPGKTPLLGRFQWEVDRKIDLSYHVRHTALARPGRIRELLEVVSRLHGTLLDRIFVSHPDIEAVIHCAGKIIVPESMDHPLEYYDANIGGLLSVIGAMQRHGCHRIVFSSSASIYSPGPDFYVDESSVLRPSSPYGRTKYMSELILDDVAASSDLRALSLRYFNPVGADPRLRTGQANPAPTHALGKLIEAYLNGHAFTITGVDLPTRDGTGLRDYIHVWDLAQAHLAALCRFDRLFAGVPSLAINVGTGSGTTVAELVAAFESVIGEAMPVVRAGPRPGDLAGCYARCDLAKLVLGWRASLSVSDGIRDALAWARRRSAVLTGVR
jgi:UDP-glucose 4-epimerase